MRRHKVLIPQRKWLCRFGLKVLLFCKIKLNWQISSIQTEVGHNSARVENITCKVTNWHHTLTNDTKPKFKPEKGRSKETEARVYFFLDNEIEFVREKWKKPESLFPPTSSLLQASGSPVLNSPQSIWLVLKLLGVYKFCRFIKWNIAKSKEPKS